jgi:hypothetical protein
MLREAAFFGVVVSLLSVPAGAHHSFAMFDVDTTFERQATLVEFQWTNPHAWLELTITDDQGESAHWSIEMSSPGSLASDGWRPRTLVPGDEVTVTFNPRRDGGHAGKFISVVTPNGEKFGE